MVLGGRNDFGIRCIIAPSFGEIFRSNAMQNGMLPLQLSPEECKDLAADAEAGVKVEVDLEKQEVRRDNGKPAITFTVDPFRRHCLLNGLDDIALTLQKENAIVVFEQRRTAVWPWLDGFGYEGNKIPIVPTKTSKKTEW
jgi:3-isopropylmalate dehydratase